MDQQKALKELRGIVESRLEYAKKMRISHRRRRDAALAAEDVAAWAVHSEETMGWRGCILAYKRILEDIGAVASEI